MQFSKSIIQVHIPDTNNVTEVIFVDTIAAGFPSPAADMMGSQIDLTAEFVKHPSSTFYGRVDGTSMINAGIDHGDFLIVDKSETVTDGRIVVCYLDGGFTLKRIRLEKDCCYLIPENDSLEPIKVTSDNDFIVWGVVIHVIKSF